jgi:hypothetical protein
MPSARYADRAGPRTRAPRCVQNCEDPRWTRSVSDSMPSGGTFDLVGKQARLAELEPELNDPALWNDPDRARVVNQEASRLRRVIDAYHTLADDVTGLAELREMAGRRRRRRHGGRGGQGRGRPRAPLPRDALPRRTHRARRDRHDQAGRRRHRVVGLGGHAAAHVPPLRRTQRLQGRAARRRRQRRRAQRHRLRPDDRARRAGVRAAVDRGRRPPPGAHQPLRQPEPSPHQLRVGRGHARDRRRHRDRPSTRRTCASTSTARPAPEASRSTRRTPRSASSTAAAPPTRSSSPARTASRRSRTGRRR